VPVAIPRGGLRAVEGENFWFYTFESPSHTVGLEQAMKMKDIKKLITESPSHTVGLEQDTLRGKLVVEKLCLHPTRWA